MQPRSLGSALNPNSSPSGSARAIAPNRASAAQPVPVLQVLIGSSGIMPPDQQSEATGITGSGDHPTKQDGALAIQLAPTTKAVVASKQYGKGKVLARKAKPTSAKLVLPPERAQGGQLVKSGEGRRFVSWLESGELEALDLNDTVGEQKAWVQLHSCQPAHLKSSGLAGQLTSLLSLQQLADDMGDVEIDAMVCIGEENTFQVPDPVKNIHGSAYHVREPRCKTLQMTFSAFAGNLRAWQSKSILLKVAIKQWSAGSADGDFALHDNPDCPSALQKLMSSSVAWDWLQGMKEKHRMGAVTGVEVEIGGRDALLPAQYVIQDRFIAQVRGTRRVLVIDPEHSFSGMYPYPMHHPYDGHSMVDWEQPDLHAWPKSSLVKGSVCMLKPGDVLYVPSCWWVHQHLTGAENAALTFTAAVGLRVRPPPAIRLRASRIVEEILGDIDGPARVLHWLQLLIEDEEEKVIDVETVAGYKQIVAVWEARDVVDSVLGFRAWTRVFPVMCDRRLRPTPWLNKDFKEPLYLTDKPRIIPDTRTDEQRRYPELFRHAQS